jgi:hypothetical protein
LGDEDPQGCSCFTIPPVEANSALPLSSNVWEIQQTYHGEMILRLVPETGFTVFHLIPSRPRQKLSIPLGHGVVGSLVRQHVVNYHIKLPPPAPEKKSLVLVLLCDGYGTWAGP